MGKVYVFLAEGFEEIEALTVVDILRRARIDVKTVSVSEATRVDGGHKINVETDLIFEKADFSDAEVLVLPGGMPGTLNLAKHKKLGKLLESFNDQNRKIAAICAAPSILGDLGILKNRTATAYPGFEDRLKGAKVTENAVEVSGNITTSRGLGTAIPFALSLVAQLKDKQTADDIKDSIIY